VFVSVCATDFVRRRNQSLPQDAQEEFLTQAKLTKLVNSFLERLSDSESSGYSGSTLVGEPYPKKKKTAVIDSTSPHTTPEVNAEKSEADPKEVPPVQITQVHSELPPVNPCPSFSAPPSAANLNFQTFWPPPSAPNFPPPTPHFYPPNVRLPNYSPYDAQYYNYYQAAFHNQYPTPAQTGPHHYTTPPYQNCHQTPAKTGPHHITTPSDQNHYPTPVQTGTSHDETAPDQAYPSSEDYSQY